MPGVERGPKSYPQTRGKRLYNERTILLAKERGRSRSRNQTRRSWASKGRRGRGAHSPSPPSLILSSPVGWKGSFFTSIPPPLHTLRRVSTSRLNLERRTVINLLPQEGGQEEPAGEGHRKVWGPVLPWDGFLGYQAREDAWGWARGPIPPSSSARPPLVHLQFG